MFYATLAGNVQCRTTRPTGYFQVPTRCSFRIIEVWHLFSLEVCIEVDEWGN